MIASLSGTVSWVEPTTAIVEAGGVGFRISLPARVLSTLRAGQHFRCYTHLVMSQDAGPTLTGFETRDELEVFLLLLRVSGVGPKAALALLDGLSVDTIRRAISTGQPELLRGVKGIGAKTAQRIVFDLRGQVAPAARVATLASSDDLDLVEALTALGYSVVEAQSAVQALPPEAGQDLESRLRAALSRFGRR